MTKTILVITLGCSKNDVDTEHLLAQLPEDRYRVLPSDWQGDADILLINTCGFIGDAKEESVNAILSAVEKKTEGHIGTLGVFGCLSQRYGKELKEEIPEVDAWFGARDLSPIVRWLGCEPVSGAGRRIERKMPYAYLKISEGCDRRCSYCAIPFIRGNHRSVPIEELEREARTLVDGGVKELILIAQDSTYYGLDIYGHRALAELIRRLSEIDGLEWIRIHYSYPADFPEDVLEEMASNPKLCKYLDIPLQHISDKVLDAMHRHVTGDKTRELISRLRRQVPGVVLRTTMIVGHPGEGAEEFDELLEFAGSAEFERLGAFTYSEEEGTWGAEHLKDEISEEEKRARLDALMSLQASISLNFNKSRVGDIETVIVDDCVDGTLVCRSQYESPEVDGEILAKLPEGTSADGLVGQFIKIKIIAADEYDLAAEVI